MIADDHDAVRGGVRSVLLSRPDIAVCAEACDGRETLQQPLALKPDLVILDLTMPVLGGFATAVELRKLLPDLERWTSLTGVAPVGSAGPGPSRASFVASTLSASLELVKEGVMEARQLEAFADIYIRARGART